MRSQSLARRASLERPAWCRALLSVVLLMLSAFRQVSRLRRIRSMAPSNRESIESVMPPFIRAYYRAFIIQTQFF